MLFNLLKEIYIYTTHNVETLVYLIAACFLRTVAKLSSS